MSKSKLSPALKALINAPFARPDTLPATSRIKSVYEQLRREASGHGVGHSPWLALSTAATMTMNSPESLTVLYNLATSSSADSKKSIQTAELMREVGLKCIGFNGVPRTINCLGAFRSSLPESITSQLSTTAHRVPTQQNINEIIERGNGLWDSVYHPFTDKLAAKLGDSHPDLPVHIINHEYGALFADPPSLPQHAKVGRVLTSVVAVACLRAQTGVGPQVVSHVFGLRKAFEDGSAEAEEEVEGGEWLGGEEGNTWVLKSVDRIVDALGDGQGSSFAPLQSKL
ncbi:hypothetical protein B0O99DRAFT_524354 [Bisporella sp. PMI_857]|nr:hypothetical protein B0O99DRAFT_524354 [Bisporella sp. PMI_857]